MQRKSRGGSVVLDKRSKVWNFYWWENGKRRSRVIGPRSQYTKTTARLAASAWVTTKPRTENIAISRLIELYREEKMPQRYSTRRSYDVWLRLYVLPRWSASPITEVQARPVELWLQSLDLTPRSRSSIRGILRILWDFAMWRGDIATQRNPMELVTIKGASKRTRQPRSLTVDEFRHLLAHLEGAFRTMALVCVCFGLRISECLALKWSDVDWLHSRLRVERGIVRQRVGDTKTTYSNRPHVIDAEMLEVLKRWKQTTQFSADGD